MNTSISLEAHIANLNAELKAKNSISLVETDLSYWAEMGITTTSQFIHNELVTEHFELYSEIHGIKPRWFKYKEMTIEQLNLEIQDLLEYSEKMEQHKKDEVEAEKLRVAEIKSRNEYQPNLAFSGLRDMLAA